MPVLYPQAKPPRGQGSAILDLIVEQLHPKTGTELDRCVRTWQVGTGDRVDEIPVESWEVGLFPILRLDPGGGQSQRVNQGCLRVQMTPSVTLGLRGSDRRDALDYWESLVRALYPEDRGFLEQLNLQYCPSYTVTLLGIDTKRWTDGIGMILRGSLVFQYDLQAIL